MNAGNKTHLRAPSTKTECDYLYGWIKKNTITCAKISPKMVNPRDLAGNAGEVEREEGEKEGEEVDNDDDRGEEDEEKEEEEEIEEEEREEDEEG